MNLEELKNLAKQLPEHQPTPDRSQDLRENLLAAVEQERVRPMGTSLWLVAGVVAVAASVAFYAGTRQSTTIAKRVVPSKVDERIIAMPQLSSPDGASFVRELTTVEGRVTQQVRLTSGSLHALATTGQQPVRVATSNAIVEGIGSFIIRASQDGLQEVIVHNGRLDVRIEDHPPMVLGPGESWVKPEQETIELAVREVTTAELKPDTLVPALKQRRSPRRKVVPEPVVVPEPAVVPEPVVVPEPEAVPAASSAELAFDAGYRAVKRGDYAHALFDLEQAISKSTQPELRADARYWRIIALARGGRSLRAKQAMEEFVGKHGKSSRGGEVATMLGWIFVEEGQPHLAKPLFERGHRDASSRVRASAQMGLKTIID